MAPFTIVLVPNDRPQEELDELSGLATQARPIAQDDRGEAAQ